MFVFDWDGVIFDTAHIKKIRLRVLKKLGYPEDHIATSVREAVESRAGYSFYEHSKILVRGYSHDPKKVSQAIHDAVDKHPGTFVFPDARRILGSLVKERHHFDILTAGHEEFQEYKIVRSGLRALFRNVHIVRPGPRVPHNKLAILKNLASSHGRAVFLDDRADTIEMVAKTPSLKGKVLPILVWRKKEKSPKGLHMVPALSWREIRKIAIHNGFGT